MEKNSELDRFFSKGGKVYHAAFMSFLEQISKEKPEAIIAFAVRNALRLLPLPTNNSVLDDKGFFVIWHALWLAAKGTQNERFKQDDFRDAAIAVDNASADNASADNAAARVAANVANAVRAATAYAYTYAARSATYAATYAVSYTGKWVILKDLHHLQQQENLIATPLFSSETPREFSQNLPAIKSRLDAIDRRIGNDLQALIDGDWLENEPWDKYLPLAKKFAQVDDPEENNLEPEKPEVKIRNTPHENLNNPAASQTDALDRQPLADALARWLGNPENKEHWTIGLFGDWGVGKSSFINFLKTGLSIDENKADSKFIYSEFNAWKYEDCGNIHAGIADEMLKGLRKGLGFLGQSRLLVNFIWQQQKLKLLLLIALFMISLSLVLSPLFSFLIDRSSTENRLLDTVFSHISILFDYRWLTAFILFLYLLHNINKVSENPLVAKARSALSLPDFSVQLGNIPVMQKQIKDLVDIRTRFFNLAENQGQQKILFVIDDLDRCRPETVVKVFEAVRLVMDIEQVVVLIAIDQRIALASLALHYKDLAQHHTADPIGIARDYIGKVVQVPILLEDPTPNEVEGYLRDTIWAKQGSENTEEKSPIASDSSATEESPQDAETHPETDAKSEVSEKNQSDVTSQTVGDAETVLPEIILKEVGGLSDKQKELFIEWSKRFQIANPRHIKRLDNAYNLLRLRYREEDEDETHYPRLALLMWVEYVNELPLEQREWLQQQSRHAQLQEKDSPLSDWLNQPDSGEDYSSIINHWLQLVSYLEKKGKIPKQSYVQLYQQVKTFALPAVEKATLPVSSYKQDD